MSNKCATQVAQAKKAFATGKTKHVSFRKKQLRGLLRFIGENEAALTAAVKADLNRPNLEAVTSEIVMTNNAIVNALDNIDQWTKDEYQSKELLTLLSSVFIKKEPFGVCLVMASWNFPISLLLVPVISAITAGNCVVIKPSECAANCAMIMQKLLPRYIDPECYPVVVLGASESGDLVQNTRFDFIFFTGGTSIGKIIMSSAAQHLTPVVLELGGKNPCYIDETCNLRTAARRVCWGRFVNAGQICLAPDYILCKSSIKDKFIAEVKLVLGEFYGKDPKQSPDYCRIINDRQVQRLKGLIQSGEGTISHGGEIVEKDRYVAPTVITDIDLDSVYMQQEMFGPILLIMSVSGVEEAIEIINKGEKPLAIYAFTSNKSVIDNLLFNTSSGGVNINDCTMQYTINSLPFGGVGQSGMGNYHGKFGFDAFSHKRACLIDGTPEMLLKVRYPPYNDWNLTQSRFLIEKKARSTGIVGFLKSLLWMGVIGLLLAYFSTLII